MIVELKVRVDTLDNDMPENVADFVRELLSPHMVVEVEWVRARHEKDEPE